MSDKPIASDLRELHEYCVQFGTVPHCSETIRGLIERTSASEEHEKSLESQNDTFIVQIGELNISLLKVEEKANAAEAERDELRAQVERISAAAQEENKK
jgi:hypothetical protein